MMEKKILLIAFLAATLIGAARTSKDVDPLLQTNFEAKFGKSTPVKWKKVEDVYIGQFIYDHQSMDCYFSNRGELLGTGRYFSSNKIDERTRAALNENFRDWNIQLAYEYTFNNELPEQMFVLNNLKFTAIVRINMYGSIEVIQKKKNKPFKNSQQFDLSRINDLKMRLLK